MCTYRCATGAVSIEDVEGNVSVTGSKFKDDKARGGWWYVDVIVIVNYTTFVFIVTI